MSLKRSKLPSPALVLATIALCLSIGGTAYAVTIAPANSVLSSSIKNNEVKSSDIRDGKVKNPDLADGAVDARVLAPGAVTPASFGTIASVTATSAATTDADGTPNGGDFNVVKVTAQCPAGSRLLTGGGQWVNPSAAGTDDENVYLQESHPSNGASAWTVEGIVDFGAQGNIRLQAQAFCLLPPGAS